ncbi:hypothetical protein [Lactococcus allomyrinae]|uniref:Uncharacterized protein n=1 Tax=Lactococcus allomyrinae TaxID=2419773 RepID=A0A387BBW9_9LACT|nr:hypothetical protein [Lactococcus allomyrinae]AYF99833.1 hypothetical protein D7I46_01275 [Lactococcus allomyrinae]
MRQQPTLLGTNPTILGKKKTIKIKGNKKEKQKEESARPPYTNERMKLEQLKRLIAKQRQKGYDVDFISKTQPSGTITFEESYVQTGSGIETTVLVDAFPQSPLPFWIVNLAESAPDVICIMNIESENKVTTRRRYQKMLREEKFGLEHAKDDSAAMEAQIEVEKLQQLILGTFQGESSQKVISVRLTIKTVDKKSHQERLTELVNTLKGGGFHAQAFPSDTKALYDAKWLSPEQTSSSFYKIAPFSISSNDLAKGYPFNHTELTDPEGAYQGRTDTGGAIFFDPWYRIGQRTASNIMILGKTGAGKSHFIKKNLDFQVALGNRIITFSKNNEYNKWTKDVNGIVVGMFSSTERINMMQVSGSVSKVNEDGSGKNEIDISASFTAHISSIVNNFRLLDRTITDTESNAMSVILNQFYIAYGIWRSPEDLAKFGMPDVTSLSPEEYPILSDLQDFVYKTLELFTDASTEYKMKTALKMLIEVGSGVFDGITNVRDLTKEQVVCFDLDTLLAQDRAFQQIQLANAFNLIVSQALISGLKQRDYVAEGGDPDGVMHTILMIDECHNLINIHNPFIAEQVTTSLRELRKLYGAIWLATQTPKEMRPSGTPQTKELMTAVESINKIVDFMTYRFLFNLDNSAEIKDLIGDNLPEEYAKAIPLLDKGQCVFMSGKTVMKMSVHFDPVRNQVYSGGE